MIDKFCSIGARRGLIFLVLGTLALIFQGCAGGVITTSAYTASGAVATALHMERQEFREDVSNDYSRYQSLFASSGCSPKEYRISQEIRDYLKDSSPREDGYAEAQDILLETYNDPTLSRQVRAHALYITALAEAEKEGGSNAQAREYLKRVKREFPGTHDCAVDKLLEEGDRIT